MSVMANHVHNYDGGEYDDAVLASRNFHVRLKKSAVILPLFLKYFKTLFIKELA